MSTKMYCHWVADADVWGVLMRARQAMLDNNPIYVQLRKKFTLEPGKFAETFRLLDELTDQHRGFTMEIQLFPRYGNWLLRGLEHGWHLRNWLSSQQSCVDVVYDNRADVPPEEEVNREIAQWMDEQIRDGRFLIFNVLHRDDFEKALFKELYKPKDIEAAKPSE